VPVFVYTNGDSAELFLNGRSLGRRTKGVVPDQPENFALGKQASASSTQSGQSLVASSANDGNASTRWCAASADTAQWWQVDLGQMQSIRYLSLDFEREEKNYGYQIKVSTDGSQWQTAATKSTSRMPRWGGPTESFHDVDVQARYVRVEFTQLQDGAWASIREFGAYPAKINSPYYDVTYKYRLRWDDVVYEPGELKVVAYKNGISIGEALMRTAGEPATIRLTADRRDLDATGQDLSYILVEALDANGTLCPLAENSIHFDIEGPAVIAGIGNGNPLSMESFQTPDHSLFYGKAMLIVRALPGEGGRIRVTAASDGLEAATVRLLSGQ
jgi:hypothetical protein